MKGKYDMVKMRRPIENNPRKYKISAILTVTELIDFEEYVKKA